MFIIKFIFRQMNAWNIGAH